MASEQNLHWGSCGADKFEFCIDETMDLSTPATLTSDLGMCLCVCEVPREWVRLEGTSGGHLIYTDEVVLTFTHIKMQ